MFTLKNQNVEIAAGQHEHLLNLGFADCSEGEDSLESGVLIGLDFYYSFVSGVVKKGTKGPVAIESCLGWMLSGPYNNLNETSTNMITTHALRVYCEQDETSLTQVMKNFWNVDSLGVTNELEVVSEFEQNLQFDGERYVVKLPIKPHHEFLPDSHENSINLMFDASSKVRDELSLNDCLYSGPCLLPAIFDILLQFRLGKIGLVSNIKQAFLNIAIAEEHRDLLRSL